MHLKIEIMRVWDTGLAMRVLEQEGIKRGYECVWAKGKYEIVTEDCPDVGEASLYIRGRNTDRDAEESTCRFESTASREAWIDAMRKGVREINGKNPTVSQSEILE